MFFNNILFLFLISFVYNIQCQILNIPMAIINTQTVIGCASSIDIYPSFDPDQVIVCPYVSIEKDKIELIYMNISFDDNNQIVIYSKPEIISPPKFYIKLKNNSFSYPLNLNRNTTYYLSFSSQLICRYSFINNETICFYYPISSNFINIEYHYDEIKYGSLILSNKTRHRFYTVFIIITIFIILICFLAIYIICTSRFLVPDRARLDIIIDTQMARQEAAAKRPADSGQDGPIGHQVLDEHYTTKEATAGDM